MGDAYVTFTLNPDAQMQVFPGDEIDALLDAAMMTVRALKMEATQKYCFEAIQRARSSKEDHSYTIQDALRILYELYSRAANADVSKSEDVLKRMVAIMTEQEQPFSGPTTPSTGATDEDELAAARIANRFDIRRIIGGVFVLYGVTLTIVGIVGSDEVKNKAAGINVNLWTGLGMLVFGVLMIVWALTRPVAKEPERIRRAPAT